ncbi:GntR family transcriptional regulator [Ramlibacter sp. G-1-2-2]|uniref:GntR family transcriptional regulator n=1 Tax=Ramlibacter agri TaxID=2728837 RepID=A0A848HDC1_9BURK|nr:GntR family transcriptional regulator [Ramlibacter agri]NML47469.1 GntR family transcriptional regulator [Ramlibacter agri]
MAKTTPETHAVVASDVPLYHQIYLHLRAEILDGGWIGRDDFPGEAELARQFGVSVITSRKALARLVEDGFIERSRGKRTRVLRGPEVARRGTVPAIIQTTIGAPRAFTYRVLSRGVGVAPVEACEAFGMPAGARLWLCSRLRSFKGRPHSVTLNAQRVDVGEQLTLAELQKYPMTQLLREHGVQFSRLTRRVSASIAPPHVARQLKLVLNEPTLVYTFTHHDDQGGVVQWVRIWVRPDEPSPEESFSYATGMWSMSTAM